MEIDNIIKRMDTLMALFEVELEAIEAYDKALELDYNDAIKAKLEEIKNDEIEHKNELVDMYLGLKEY